MSYLCEMHNTSILRRANLLPKFLSNLSLSLFSSWPSTVPQRRCGRHSNGSYKRKETHEIHYTVTLTKCCSHSGRWNVVQTFIKVFQMETLQILPLFNISKPCEIFTHFQVKFRYCIFLLKFSMKTKFKYLNFCEGWKEGVSFLCK